MRRDRGNRKRKIRSDARFPTVNRDWLVSVIPQIESHAMPLRDACAQARIGLSGDLVEHISPGLFYNALEYYGLEMNCSLGRPPHRASELDPVLPIITEYRRQGLAIGVTKMFHLLKQERPEANYSYRMIWYAYQENNWLRAAAVRGVQEVRCRYECLTVNGIWHADIHYISHIPGCYVYGIIDDKSRYLTGLYLITSKDSKTVSEKLEESIRKYGPVGFLWTDNGGENVGGPTKAVMEREAVALLTTQPCTPQQNGKIERLWPSLERMTNADPASLQRFRDNYNNVIPHTALGWKRPAEAFAEQHYVKGDPVQIKVTEPTGDEVIKTLPRD